MRIQWGVLLDAWEEQTGRAAKGAAQRSPKAGLRKVWRLPVLHVALLGCKFFFSDPLKLPRGMYTHTPGFYNVSKLVGLPIVWPQH